MSGSEHGKETSGMITDRVEQEQAWNDIENTFYQARADLGLAIRAAFVEHEDERYTLELFRRAPDEPMLLVIALAAAAVGEMEARRKERQENRPIGKDLNPPVAVYDLSEVDALCDTWRKFAADVDSRDKKYQPQRNVIVAINALATVADKDLGKDLKDMVKCATDREAACIASILFAAVGTLEIARERIKDENRKRAESN